MAVGNNEGVPSSPPPASARKFAVLRSRHSGPYVVFAGLSMMGDNIEHVLSYWVLWETFHSPALVGFQLLSHWLPFLLGSVYAGALAERYDCRRLIQIAQGMFIAVSLAWGVLFATGTLSLWAACVLLVIHGVAGTLWAPAEQMMLYDFAGPRTLTSAVRINATFRSLGVLFGPVIGSLLLVAVGPTAGIFINVIFYLPMTLFLFRTPYTGHTRAHAPRTKVTLLDSFRVLGTVRHHKSILTVLVLAALASTTVGTVLQNAMPVFGNLLAGATDPDLMYGSLLFALGAGAVLGGLALEVTGWVKPNLRAVIIATATLGAFAAIFSLTRSPVLALAALFLAGISQITSESVGMSIVQLQAPDDQRGRVIGSYSMFGPGMRSFSGITVGVLGSFMGIPSTVLFGGLALIFATLLIVVAIRPEVRQS